MRLRATLLLPICADVNRTVSSTGLTFSDDESKYSWCNIPGTGIQRCLLRTERKLCPCCFYHSCKNLYNLTIHYTMQLINSRVDDIIERWWCRALDPPFKSPFLLPHQTNCDSRTLRRHTVSLLKLPSCPRSTSSLFDLTDKLLAFYFRRLWWAVASLRLSLGENIYQQQPPDFCEMMSMVEFHSFSVEVMNSCPICPLPYAVRIMNVKDL